MKSIRPSYWNQYETIYIWENKLKQVLPTHEKIACTVIIIQRIFANLWFIYPYSSIWICDSLIQICAKPVKLQPHSGDSRLSISRLPEVEGSELENPKISREIHGVWVGGFFPNRFFPTWEQTYPLLKALLSRWFSFSCRWDMWSFPGG